MLFNSAEALLIGDQWRLSARQSSKSDTSYGYPTSYFTWTQTVSPVGLLDAAAFVHAVKRAESFLWVTWSFTFIEI